MMYPNTVYNPNMYSTNNMPVPPNVNMGHMGYAANAHNMPPPPMNYSPSMPSVPRHSIVHQHPTLLVVEDLPVECSEGDLLLLIQPYARVKSINMNRHPQRRNSTFAVVEFHMPEQGEGARVNLDGMFFMGRKLRVFWDTNNQTGLHAASSSPYAMAASNPVAAKFVRTAQVHISYLSKQLNSIVSEEFLRDIFSNFGEVVEVALKKVSIDPDMYIQNGYGFVHFPLTDEGVKSALQAVSALHQVTINHITYDCSISNQLRQVLAQMERDRNGGVNSRSSHGAAPMMQNQFPRNVMPKMASGGSYYGNRNVGYNMPEPQASYVPSTTYSNRFPRGMMDNKAHYSDAQQQAPGNEYYQTDFAASNQYETSSVHSGHWSGASSIFSHASTSSSTNNPSPVPTFRDINGPVPGMHGSFNYSDPAPIPGSAREFFRGAEFQQNFEQQFEQLNMNSGFPMASDSRPRNSSSPSQVLDNISVTSNLSGGNEAPKLSSSLNTSVLTDNIFLFESNASVRERATTSDGNFPLGPPRYLSNSSVSTVDLSSSWNGTSQTSLLADSLDEFDSQITLKAWKTEVSQPSTDETVRSGSNFDAQLEALCSEN